MIDSVLAYDSTSFQQIERDQLIVGGHTYIIDPLIKLPLTSLTEQAPSLQSFSFDLMNILTDETCNPPQRLTLCEGLMSSQYAITHTQTIRNSLNVLYHSLSIVYSSILMSTVIQDRFNSTVCTSEGTSIRTYLKGEHCLFNKVLKSQDLPFHVAESGGIILFADIIVEDGIKYLHVYAWGTVETPSPFQFTVKLLSPVNEFRYLIDFQMVRLGCSGGVVYSHCTDGGLVQSLFGHIVAELLSNEKGQLTVSRTIRDVHFCSKCHSNTKLKRSSCVECSGCHGYYHSGCLDSVDTSTREVFCCDECRDNTFLTCTVSHIRYPRRAMRRCIICNKPFGAEKEIWLRKMCLYCCSECINEHAQKIQNAFMKKCLTLTASLVHVVVSKSPAMFKDTTYCASYLLGLVNDIHHWAHFYLK